MSAPASDLGLRRDVVPNDFTLPGTLALQSAFGKVPEFMQLEFIFDYLLAHCIAPAALKQQRQRRW